KIGDNAPVLEAPVMLAGAAPAGLHLIRDTEASVFSHDVIHDLEVLRRRRHHAAYALDRLADETGDLTTGFVADPGLDGAGPTGFVADRVLDAAGAPDVARGIRQAKWAAVAIPRRGVLDVVGHGQRVLPRPDGGQADGRLGAAVIGVAERKDVAAPGMQAGHQ